LEKKIRIGVMGCASIAERSMIPAIQTLTNEFELVAIASRTKEKAEKLATKFNCEAIVGYENIVNHQHIDALYLPLPSGLLHDWIPKCLNAGKHVYAEKSIALDSRIALEMIEIARSKNLVLMEGFMFQYHSQHKQVKELIKNGLIGEIRHFSASFGFPPLDNSNFRYDPNLGGGALFDAGAYPVRATFFMLGDQMEISGASLRRINSNNAALFGSAYFNGSNGVGASISFGFDNFYQCNYTLWGSIGKLTVERAFTPGPNLKPKIIVEKNINIQVIEADADNHFEKALVEFKLAISNDGKKEKHYTEIAQQSLTLYQINKIG
jgi:NDP-hexose-3-ketoreductase